MEAGRELDAKVAAEVFGWTRIKQTGSLLRGVGDLPPHGPTLQTVPHYSTDIADAWQVVEHMIDRGYQLLTLEYSFGRWLVISEWPEETSDLNPDREPAKGKADTPALAICLAALEMVEFCPWPGSP